MNPISYQEISAYFGLCGLTPAQWQLDLLRKLDGVVLELAAEDAKRQEKRRGRP